MADSVDQVAAKIGAAFAESPLAGVQVQGALAADRLQINHEPAQPGDGIWDGVVWARALVGAIEALQKALPDFRQNAEFTTVGDEIHVATTTLGTLKDGVALNHTNRSVFTIKDGKIVKAINNSQGVGNSRALLMKAFADSAAP
jgi:hypothetical protein